MVKSNKNNEKSAAVASDVKTVVSKQACSHIASVTFDIEKGWYCKKCGSNKVTMPQNMSY